MRGRIQSIRGVVGYEYPLPASDHRPLVHMRLEALAAFVKMLSLRGLCVMENPSVTVKHSCQSMMIRAKVVPVTDLDNHLGTPKKAKKHVKAVDDDSSESDVEEDNDGYENK